MSNSLLQLIIIVIIFYYTESFCIVHQSPSEYTIATGESIALFCIASQHSFSLRYTWDNMHGVVGAKSPVLFANKSGVYRCTVENDGQKCYSRSIFITEKGYRFIIMLIIPTCN